MERVAKGVLFILLAFSLAGCPFIVGGGAAVGTYYLIQGDPARPYRTSYGKAWEAANLTLEEMQMSIVREKRGETEGKIEAKRADGSPVTVWITSKASDVIELRVRIGPVGDKAKGELFHERFRKNLFG